MHEHEPGVRQAGQRVGQRVLLRLFEDDRVVDDGGGLFADAVQEPAVVVGVAAGVDVVDREGADEPLVEDQRADQGGLEAGGPRHPRRFEVGARTRVDQRPPVAGHPARQALAVLHRDLLHEFGVDPGRKPAAQGLGLFVVEEERAAREGDEIGQLRGDERHRIGHAEAGAHRLGNLVERVNLPMGQRNVVEHALGRRRLR